MKGIHILKQYYSLVFSKAFLLTFSDLKRKINILKCLMLFFFFFLIQFMKPGGLASTISSFGVTTLEEATVNTLDYFPIQSLFTPAHVGAKDDKKSISFP